MNALAIYLSVEICERVRS